MTYLRMQRPDTDQSIVSNIKEGEDKHNGL